MLNHLIMADFPINILIGVLIILLMLFQARKEVKPNPTMWGPTRQNNEFSCTGIIIKLE